MVRQLSGRCGCGEGRRARHGGLVVGAACCEPREVAAVVVEVSLHHADEVVEVHRAIRMFAELVLDRGYLVRVEAHHDLDDDVPHAVPLP